MSETNAAAPPPAASPRAARPRRWELVAGLVAGLVVGGGGVGIAWAIAGTGPSAENVDANAACTLAHSASRPDRIGGSKVLVRWSAAKALATAAADADPRYKPLEKALRNPALVAGGVGEAASPEFEQAAQQVRDLCADL